MKNLGEKQAPSFFEILSANARKWPEAIYAHSIDQQKSVNYKELYGVSNQIAGFLKNYGVGRNQRVLLLSENSIENFLIFVSTLRYGATLATVHVEMNKTHLAEIIESINPVLVIYQPGLDLEFFKSGTNAEWIELGEWSLNGNSEGFFKEIAEFNPEDELESIASPDDHGVIFYTSGTVDRPKGVIQTHATAYYNYDSTADYLGLEPGIRTLDCRSYSWLSAQHMSLGAPLVSGATTIFARHFSQSRYFDWLKDYKINIGFVVPTMINMLINRPSKINGSELGDLNFLTSSSAPLLPEQWRDFERMYGITLSQSCGSSEGGNTAAHRGANRKIGSVGPPQKYQKIRIIDQNGQDLDPGDTGEIVVGGGKQQALGYLHHNGEVELLPKTGHCTGDLGYFDIDGHLHITGRVKELIIRGGVNISPVEVDSILIQHPSVAEAGTFGMPDPIYGEEVAAFVVIGERQSVTPDDIIEHCRRYLPEAKMPKNIFIVEELPKNPRGKLDRASLLNLWQSKNKGE